jgi:dTDP-glucose 4,6-dehydratase
LDKEDPSPQFRPHTQLIEYVTDRPGHDRRYAMNIEKINRELGWSPSVDLEEGLKKTVTWYLDNLAWLNAIIKEKDYQNWVQINYQGRNNL